MDKGKKNHIKYLTYAGIITAVYAVLTLISEPISYGVIQVRIAEALNVLPMFTGAAVPGLAVGCLAANLIGGGGIIDVIVGTASTLISALIARKIKNKWLVPLPAVIINAVLVGAELYFVYGKTYSVYLCMLFVLAGQTVACYGLGIPLMLLLSKYSGRLFPADIR